MALIDLINPATRCLLSGRLLRQAAGRAALVFAYGFWLGRAPDDDQQGATVKIMFIHVPSAWLAMFGWMVMSIAALGTLVWRHPLADMAAGGRTDRRCFTR